MSKENPSFRIMIIDIAEDKVIVDEFCDAVVAGIARKGDNGKETDCSEILACKSNLICGVGAVDAAEKAIQRQKKGDYQRIHEKCNARDDGRMLRNGG